MGGNYTGIWVSEYQYTSSSRQGIFTSRHYVRAFQEGSVLVFESVPGVNESYIIVRLVVDGAYATGSWQEITNPDGYYKGAIYYGAIQFALSADGKQLTGKWAGFSKDGTINDGPWKFTYLGQELPADAEILQTTSSDDKA